MIKKYRKAIAVFAIIVLLIGVLSPRVILRAIYLRKYSDLVEVYTEQYQIPVEIVYAVIKTESNFEADAVSPKGAVGLMQITPDTFSWLAEMLNEPQDASLLVQPEINIQYGVYYLHFLYQYYGDWGVTFAAYNAGMGNVSKWLSSEKHSKDGKLIAIPFEETRNYVRLVIERTQIYQKLYK